MTFSRRSFLHASGAASLAAALGLGGRALAATAPTRPRFLIQLFLRGGIDAVFTTDPKLRAQVDPRVDLPYEESEILDLGRHRVGPFFAALREQVPQMAILNGVDHGTVAHDYGASNIAQMRRHYPVHHELSVGLTGRLGELLASTPLNESWMIGSPVGMPTFLPAAKGFVMRANADDDGTLIEKLWHMVNVDGTGKVATRVLAEEAARCTRAGGSDCSSMHAVRGMLDRMSGTELPERPKLTIALDDPTNGEFVRGSSVIWSRFARDTAYLLKHGLTRTIFCAVPHAFFDTHQNNTPGQRRSCLVFAEGLKLLFATLRAATTADGVSLYDQTAFLITSEVGRNPFLNAAMGKDHFPHHPVILMGPGIRPGQYGLTDRTLAGLAVSAETGMDSPRGRKVLPNLDDVGATILRWFGMDAPAAGYTGRPLDFLFA